MGLGLGWNGSGVVCWADGVVVFHLLSFGLIAEVHGFLIVGLR